MDNKLTQHHLLKGLSFPHSLAVSLCHKTVYNTRFGFCLLIHWSIVYPCPNTIRFHHLSLLMSWLLGSINPPGLLFFKISLDILGSFRFHKSFRISLVFHKRLAGCDWDCFDTVYPFGRNSHYDYFLMHAYSISLHLFTFYFNNV